MSKAELLAHLDDTVERGRKVLAGLDRDRDLNKELSLQGYQVNGLAALYHTIEHASQHMGQILFIAKQLEPGFELYPQHADE